MNKLIQIFIAGVCFSVGYVLLKSVSTEAVLGAGLFIFAYHFLVKKDD